MARSGEYDEPVVARVPADVERPDELLFGLTARQVAILAVTGVVLWAGYAATNGFLPAPVFLAITAPMWIGVAVVVWGRRDGLGLDRVLMAGLRFARSPRRLVPARATPAPVPDWVSIQGGPVPGVLRLPARRVHPSGVVDLGSDGAAVLLACSTVNFSLRTPGEQRALIDAFGRYLNSLTGPAQLLVRARRVDLNPAASRVREDAPGLAHPALERAALDYAAFLDDLAETRDLLARQVLLVLREPVTGSAGVEAAGRRVLRRAEDAAQALAAAEVRVTILDGAQATEVLTAATDPTGPVRPPGMTPPGATITGTRTRR